MTTLLVAYVVVMSTLTLVLAYMEPEQRRARRLRRESRKHGLQFKARGSAFAHRVTSEPDPSRPRASYSSSGDR